MRRLGLVLLLLLLSWGGGLSLSAARAAPMAMPSLTATPAARCAPVAPARLCDMTCCRPAAVAAPLAPVFAPHPLFAPVSWPMPSRPVRGFRWPPPRKPPRA